MSLSDMLMDSDDFDLSRPPSTSPSLTGTEASWYSQLYSDSDFPYLSGALTKPLVELSPPDHQSQSPDVPYQADLFLIFKGEDDVVSEDEVACRYSQRLFASKSTVFNCFLFSQVQNCDLFVRGTHESGDPLITLVGVSSREAKHFLNALYDASFFEGPPNPTSLEVVMSVFRLSSKYQVHFLRRRALKHLELAFPHDSLSSWDTRDKMVTFDIKRTQYPGEVSPSLSSTLEIIEACTMYVAPWILPAAFYDICLYEMGSLLVHPKWTDGSLTEEIKNQILLGYSSHWEESSQVLSFLHMESLGSCTNDPNCVEYRRKVLKTIFTDATQRRSMQDFLGKVWDDDDWEEADMNEMCDICIRICQARHAEARSEAWMSLPGKYGLPSWDDLEALRNNDPAMCSK